MKAILVDSDILIEVSRGKDRLILERWNALANSDSALFCSPVTVAEIWHGARANEHAVLKSLFAAVPCITIDLEIGVVAGGYMREYWKSHRVELGDALIAATATTHKLDLWTRNRKHYPMKALTFAF